MRHRLTEHWQTVVNFRAAADGRCCARMKKQGVPRILNIPPKIYFRTDAQATTRKARLALTALHRKHRHTSAAVVTQSDDKQGSAASALDPGLPCADLLSATASMMRTPARHMAMTVETSSCFFVHLQRVIRKPASGDCYEEKIYGIEAKSDCKSLCECLKRRSGERAYLWIPR